MSRDAGSIPAASTKYLYSNELRHDRCGTELQSVRGRDDSMNICCYVCKFLPLPFAALVQRILQRFLGDTDDTIPADGPYMVCHPIKCCTALVNVVLRGNQRRVARLLG